MHKSILKQFMGLDTSGKNRKNNRGKIKKEKKEKLGREKIRREEKIDENADYYCRCMFYRDDLI